MTLETHLNKIMEKLLESYNNKSITIEQLIHTLDLTLLDEHASSEALAQLNREAHQHQVAAVCVFMEHLQQCSSKSMNLATVINFPLGIEELSSSLASINEAAQLGAVEIDYVLPYRQYLAGNKKQALSQCHAVSQLCKQQKLTLKIIVETGAFPDIQTIYSISKELIESGCDFIKTSTGKIPKGASMAAAFAILSAIKDTKNAFCGIKISGGIKIPQQAYNYAMLAKLMIDKPIDKSWFRIGASSLLGELTLCPTHLGAIS